MERHDPTVSTLVGSGLYELEGVAVDGAGNVYIADYNPIEELPRAFVPGGPVFEGAAAGSDQLLPILPTTESLTGVFAPSSDQPWLTIGSVSGGVIPFSFTQNTRLGSHSPHHRPRSTDHGDPVARSPLSGDHYPDSKARPAAPIRTLVAPTGAWSATSNASWLHTTSSGFGNGVAVFTFDANSGPTAQRHLDHRRSDADDPPGRQHLRGGQPGQHLVSSLLNSPEGVALDGAGNVYIADTYQNAIEEWMPRRRPSAPSSPRGCLTRRAWRWTTRATSISPIPATTRSKSGCHDQDGQHPVSSGLIGPEGVAVDGAGNVYIADTYNNEIKEWEATTQTVRTLVSSGLILAVWRSGGQLGQRLHRRFRPRRDQGVECHDAERQHPGFRGADTRMA